MRKFQLCFVLLSAAAMAAEREPVEGRISQSGFGFGREAVSEFAIPVGESARLVPYRVPEGKVLRIRQVTATCSMYSGTRMVYWTVRSSANTLTHHYLPIRATNPDDGQFWIASERVTLSVPAGQVPVATFLRNYFGGVNDACIGSWSGYLVAAP